MLTFPSAGRVSITSENGHGTLVIRDVKESDQGAYTCEAINARGMIFGIPDSVLSLSPGRGEPSTESSCRGTCLHPLFSACLPPSLPT